MFARTGVNASAAAPPHAEFLIDRRGYIRARWIDLPAAGAARTAEILEQIERLDAEPSRATPDDEHAH
jgi:putative copper resistance protein D